VSPTRRRRPGDPTLDDAAAAAAEAVGTAFADIDEVAAAPEEPAWLGMRRGAGRALTYRAFESALRDLGERVGVRVSAHMFRHALGQALVEEAGLEVAREVLGHAHISTTANSYARVDEDAMAAALARVAGLFDLAAREPAPPEEGGYLFDYDHATLAELEQAAGRHGGRPT